MMEVILNHSKSYTLVAKQFKERYKVISLEVAQSKYQGTVRKKLCILNKEIAL